LEKPVTALLEYLVRQGSQPEALFQWQDKMPISKHRFVEVVRKTLTAANLSAMEYAGLSF